MRLSIYLVFSFYSFLSLNSETCYAYNQKIVLGGAENVILFPGEEHLQLNAKLDTGAQISSLSAQNIKIFTIDGIRYVKFTIDHNTLPFLLEKTLPIVKKVSIKKNYRYLNVAGNIKDRRPVVKLKICIGNVSQTIDVNLVNRENFNYPLLIGKEAITKFNAVVDPTLTNNIPPTCNL